MDAKEKIIKLILILSAFLCVSLGASLLIVGIMYFINTLIYVSISLITIGTLIYIALIIMFVKYFKSKE